MIQTKLKGMGVALITPFKEDESVDYDALMRLVDYQLQNNTGITQTQGGSAGAVSINVRGLTSITGNNQPLIILDGVPIRNGGTGKSTDLS